MREGEVQEERREENWRFRKGTNEGSESKKHMWTVRGVDNRGGSQRPRVSLERQHNRTTDSSSNGGSAAFEVEEVDEFGAAVLVAIRVGDGLDVIVVNAFGDNWWYHDEAYRMTAH